MQMLPERPGLVLADSDVGLFRLLIRLITLSLRSPMNGPLMLKEELMYSLKEGSADV